MKFIMIRHEVLHSLVRFYPNQSNDAFAQYSAIANIFWESPETVCILGFHGKVSRKDLIDLFLFLTNQGIKFVKAHRDSKRQMPFAKYVNDTEVIIDLSDVQDYLSKKKKIVRK